MQSAGPGNDVFFDCGRGAGYLDNFEFTVHSIADIIYGR
jgi:hypothetical protein